MALVLIGAIADFAEPVEEYGARRSAFCCSPLLRPTWLRRRQLGVLQDLQAWGISLVAQTGLQFDLRSAQGKLIASLMAALAEFERDLLRERVRSGIAAARQRGVVFGRRPRSARQGGPFRAQSAQARRRRPVVPGNKPPPRAEQEYGPGYRQAQPRSLACFKFRFVSSPQIAVHD